MRLSPNQKDHLEDLLKQGDELEAVRYLQNSLGLSAEEALKLTEKLDKTVAETPEVKMRRMLGKTSKDLIKQSKVGRWIGGIFLFFGLIMLGVACYIFYTNYTFSEKAIPVDGKVVRFSTYYSTDDDGNRTLMYNTIFEYEYQGEVYEHESEVSSSSPDYDEGEIVEILIDPSSPNQALANTFWDRWFMIVIMGFFGVAFTGGGLMAFRMS